MTAIRLVAFDMAGTTIQDRGEVPRAYREAFDRHHMSVTADDIQAWRGAAKAEVFRHFAGREFGEGSVRAQEAAEAAFAEFHTVLRETYVRLGVATIPGAEVTFQRLRAAGVKVALMTGFDRAIADILLGAVGWGSDLVDAIVSSDDVPMGRPAPYLVYRAMERTGVTDIRHVLVVGDTVNDLLAGANSGARGVVGVLTGSQGVDKLGAVYHTHLLPSVAGLPALLEAEFA